VLKQNTTSTVSWSITDAAGNAVSSSYLSATTGDSVTMTEGQFASARNGTTGVIVTGSITDGTTFSDKISVLRVQDGAVGATGATGPTGPTGPTGAPGSNGVNGQNAFVFSQAHTPTGTISEGAGWYKSDTKEWFRYTSGSWVKMGGNLAALDAITATYIAAGAINASHLDITNGAGTGARVSISNNLISVYDSSNVLRVRMGIW
jgi:hypothetical protein